MLTDYLFCHLQELIQVMTETVSDYMYQRLKLIEIKEFNVLIDGKCFFDLRVKYEEAYEKVIEMSNNNDYTT